MQIQKKNIRIFNSESILVLLIFFIGFLLLSSPETHPSYRFGNPVTTEVSFDHNYAVPSSGFRLQFFQNNLMSIRSDYKLLTYNKTPFLENQKVDIKISLLRNIHKNLKRILIPITRLSFSPGENDEFPFLS